MSGNNTYNIIIRFSVLSGVVLAASISLLNRENSLITQPLIGLIVSFVILGASFFSESVLLRFVIVYLLGVLVNQSMLASIELKIADSNVTLFWHLPVLVLFFAAIYHVYREKIKEISGTINNCLLAIMLIGLHVVFLRIILIRSFGFGYENSPQILANLLVFSIFLSGLVVYFVDKLTFRCAAGILCSYFTGMIIIN